ncbi:hypothetical protein SLS62_010421 [Diatrype stigma]|uniref:Zn(2)-C6 fungal-type domain-containing protein n=1 Tax=Diatrype stigma TaxID=117547 RepID=A0AAN9YIA5_9PEZI
MSSSHRRHVTTACIPCRRSKVKCDGGVPVCSHCKNKGKGCQYHPAADKRKSSLKDTVNPLLKRIHQLTCIIENLNLPVPPMDQDTEAIMAKFDSSIPVGHRSRASISTAQLSSEIHQSGFSSDFSEPSPGSNVACTMEAHRTEDPKPHRNTNSDPLFCGGSEMPVDIPPASFFDGWTNNSLNLFNGSKEDITTMEPNMLDWHVLSSELDLDADIRLGQSPENFAFPDLETATIRQPPALSPNPAASPRTETGRNDADDVEGLIDQLSDRVGALRIGPHGQTRFYGPTSNFNLVEMPAADNSTVHRTIRDNGGDTLERLGLGQEVPQELEQHLTNLYFTWQDPSLHIVDRAMYEKSRALWTENREDTAYFSESLRNAM